MRKIARCVRQRECTRQCDAQESASEIQSVSARDSASEVKCMFYPSKVHKKSAIKCIFYASMGAFSMQHGKHILCNIESKHILCMNHNDAWHACNRSVYESAHSM